MNIKDLRSKTNLSQSKFAVKLGIPVRTLQQWEQGKCTPPAYVLDLIQNKINAEHGAENRDYISKYRLNSGVHWKKAETELFANCQQIHPLQREKVKLLVEKLSQCEEINRVIVFGSSVNNRCNIYSDVDVYAEMNKDFNPLPKDLPFETDFWNNFNTDERLRKEIEKKGVVVYAREQHVLVR